MKKSILTISFSLFIIISAIGQHQEIMMNKEKKEKIRAQKVGFITEKLQLTPEEAQVFWPVYNEYQNKKEKIHEEKRTTMRKFQKDLSEMSDKEIENIADKYVDFKIYESKLLEEYHKKFKNILPAHKVVKLYQAENQFKHYLLKQIKKGCKK